MMRPILALRALNLEQSFMQFVKKQFCSSHLLRAFCLICTRKQLPKSAVSSGNLHKSHLSTRRRYRNCSILNPDMPFVDAGRRAKEE
jgi:hypothetical protein